MHFLLLILLLFAVSLYFTLKQKAKANKTLGFYILIIIDLYLAGVLVYFLSSAVFS